MNIPRSGIISGQRTLNAICCVIHFLCRLRSIATHRDHSARRLSVCPSVCLSHFPKLCFAGDTCIPRNAATIFHVDLMGGHYLHINIFKDRSYFSCMQCVPLVIYCGCHTNLYWSYVLTERFSIPYNKRPKGPHIVHLSTICHLFEESAKANIFVD